MSESVPVSAILTRVPQRARDAYHHLAGHRDTRYDQVTGWAYAYLSQEELARSMGCALRTVTRAISDLRGIGVARVLAWPGAATETSLRVDDVHVPYSVFGPVRLIQMSEDNSYGVDQAISRLLTEYDEILWDIELAYADYSDGAT